MRNNKLADKILKNFPHQPTEEQQRVVELWEDFLLGRDARHAFVLKGYAGTGKTSLVAALVKTCRGIHQRVVLLAPTGRAAKVMNEYSGIPAYTVHKFIYRRQAFDFDEHFQLAPNLQPGTLFIVDEASMIQNSSVGGSIFGDGRLLDDLVEYVYGGQGCRLMMVGDEAQLPPVGELESPALNEVVLGEYGLHVSSYTLREVVRQEEDSGVLWNATMLRMMLESSDVHVFPCMRTKGFCDVRVVNGETLVEALESSYSQVGEDETIIVTRSNRRAGQFNQGIRTRTLGMEDELCVGDRIMVVKNNYRWLLQAEGESQSLTFIANGDMAVVERYYEQREVYGMRFADVRLRLPDYDDMELSATVMLDTLHSDTPALPAERNRALWKAVWEDYSDVPSKKQRIARMKEDVHLNALQIKYAYAVTCHKAQGGQWAHVYIDQGYVTEDMLSEDYFRWLYTAVTRATERVYLIGWPRNQVDESEDW